MVKSRIANIAILGAIVIHFGAAALGARGWCPTKMRGHVIARDAIIGLAETNQLGYVELVVLQLDRDSAARLNSEFIKLRINSSKPLSPDVTDGSLLLEFEALREKTCDQFVFDGLFIDLKTLNSQLPPNGSFVLVPTADKNLPVVKSRLPCYLVGGTKFALPANWYRNEIN